MSIQDERQVAQALSRIRDITDAQLPSLKLPKRRLDPPTLQRFSADLPATLPEDEEQRLRSEIQRLSPWLQGPFYLGGDVVIEGTSRDDERWNALAPYLPDITGRRLLDVGADAGYDSFMFKMLGASEVIACAPFGLVSQSRFLETVYQSGVRFEEIGWQRLDPEVHGTFDLVHCNGVLHHEPNPLGMLHRLRSMLAEDGVLLLGSMMLADPTQAEYARFAGNEHERDPRRWWVPGRLALRWMMDAAGLEAEPLPFSFSGPDAAFDVTNGYMRGRQSKRDVQLDHVDATAGAADAAPARPLDAPANRFPTGHYYSPMYDSRELASRREQIWPQVLRETAGIDWRDAAQVELCRAFGEKPKFDFVEQSPDDPTVYFTRNDQYPPLDAWVLVGMLERFRPSRMIEIGSGFSTLVSARANRERLDRSVWLTCIEPYPRDFLTAGVDGVSELRVEKIQDTPLELFAQLSAGDVLFVDTAHTVKTGGDVTWIFGEIIPRLAPGVLVHIHDVFLPGDYPETWVMEGWGWNEVYLVQAFLSFNDQFDILWGAQYMLYTHPDEVIAAFPALPRDAMHGGSLWIQRRQG